MGNSQTNSQTNSLVPKFPRYQAYVPFEGGKGPLTRFKSRARHLLGRFTACRKQDQRMWHFLTQLLILKDLAENRLASEVQADRPRNPTPESSRGAAGARMQAGWADTAGSRRRAYIVGLGYSCGSCGVGINTVSAGFARAPPALPGGTFPRSTGPITVHG